MILYPLRLLDTLYQMAAPFFPLREGCLAIVLGLGCFDLGAIDPDRV